MESVNGSRMPLPPRRGGMGFEWKLGKKSSRHRYSSALLILYGDAMSREHLHRIPSQSCFLEEKLGIFFFFSFNRVSGWIEQRRFMKPFLEKRDSYLEFLCICELLLVPLKPFSLSLSRDTLSREEKNVLRNRIFFKENKNSSNQSWISEDVIWAMEEEIKENWQDIIRTLRESRFQFLSYFCFFFFIVIDRFN